MFLVTTALNEFWDKEEDILFLGEWCKLYYNKNGWRDIENATLMDYPFYDNEIKKKAFYCCKAREKKLFFHLKQTLNNIHGIYLNEKYWEIVLGNWLQIYVTILYERYICIKNALKKFPRLNTITLDESSYIIPKDDLSFNRLSRTDLYNLQIFSQIFKALGFSFEEKKATIDYKSIVNNVIKKEKNKNVIRTVFDKIAFSKFNGKCLYNNINVSKLGMIKIAILSKFNYLPMSNPGQINLNGIETNVRIRNELKSIIKKNYNISSEFENVLLELLPQNLPEVFLEGFFMAHNKIGTLKTLPEVIISDSSIKNNIQQLFLLAEVAMNGGKVLLVQHGGGYGTYALSQTKQWEVEVSDRFFSWGWTDKNHSNIRPLPNIIHRMKNNIKKKKKKRRILFIGSNYPRYTRRIESLPIGPQSHKYFEWQIEFFRELSISTRKKFVVRPYPVDLGWNQKKRIQDSFPEICIDNENSFYKQIREVDLIVIDNNQTAYLETFALNIPTIIFWDTSLWDIHDRAKPFFTELLKIGVFNESPKLAAKQVMKIELDPMRWWLSNEVQIMIKKFVKNFAKSHKYFPIGFTEIKDMASS